MTRYAMSRRSRKAIIGLFLLALATAFVLEHSCVRQSPSKPAQSSRLQNSADIEKYHGRQFTVVKVVDGDTLDIDIPDANYNHTRIRLWGVDTPETKNPRTGPMFFGKEASEFSTRAALGKRVTVYLDTDRNSRDKYHRLLAYVQLPDGNSLNELLLNEGYAYADWRFRHGLYYKYKQLESVARSQGKGLWADVNEAQMPKWRQKEN